ncbi:MAG: 30S ribosomal protein S9 [Candidatus Pacearchaeota archaeon]|nr:MAG: 30S ribosomal protein S9 [Candidatus Pacearchaeota archaeon]
MPRKSKTKEKKPKIIVVSGMRKRSVARATIKPGTGIIRINQKPIDLFTKFQNLILKEPLMIAENILKEELKEIDIEVAVRGGGVESQVEASRLAIARALVVFTKNQELKKAFLNYDRSLLIADTRHKEMYKPGDSKARRKRQKSYR